MKRLFRILCAALASILLLPFGANAASQSTYVNLNDLTYSIDNSSYQSIKKYDSLGSFLKDYESGSLPDIYVTDFLFDGISSVKTPDLDDFIEEGSNDANIKTLDITVININATGDYIFSGEITGAMIGVNTNNQKGDINIVLNNASIDTDSKKAPAIYVYNQDKNYTDCKVAIKTMPGTKNYLEGGKLKKVSLIGSDKLANYSKYYSGDTLSNYNAYSSYYGIYTSAEIEKVLFATVQADNEDLQDGDPYYFYKASGAISSDIDLYFEGEGYLKVTSKNKEGIETKGNLTFDGGKGDYEIHSQDDCLNTTTANSSAETVRNDLTINVGSLLAVVAEDADEGDAIDSNGKLTINGGNIYAFAHPTSGDAGLDSVGGTYINGGTVIATGNMADQISNESKQNFLFATFSGVEADSLIVAKDQDDQILMAFKTSRAIKNLLYSSPDLEYENYKLYVGGEISGQETNGLYTEIDSYTGGEEITFNDMGSNKSANGSNHSVNVAVVALVVETLLLALAMVAYYKNA